MVLRAHGLSARVGSGYEPAARKGPGVECRLGGSILKIAFQRVGSVNARIGVLVWPHGAAGLAWHSHVVAFPLVRALVRERV